MVSRAAVILILALVAIHPCSGQTSQSDSQTLQAILSEIRAIREEVRATETTQILLTQLELQQGVVNRATERVNDLQSKLVELKAQEKQTADELSRAKDRLDQVTDPGDMKALSDRIADLKTNSAVLETAEKERSGNLQTAQQNLQTAQDALDDIETQLSSIVKQLAPARN